MKDPSVYPHLLKTVLKGTLASQYLLHVFIISVTSPRGFDPVTNFDEESVALSAIGAVGVIPFSGAS